MNVINVYFDCFNQPTKLAQLPWLSKMFTQRGQLIPGDLPVPDPIGIRVLLLSLSTEILIFILPSHMLE